MANRNQKRLKKLARKERAKARQSRRASSAAVSNVGAEQTKMIDTLLGAIS